MLFILRGLATERPIHGMIGAVRRYLAIGRHA
jgi:hypothetical protein